MAACEVRVPTYKRPDLLERALKSLISQTHTDWYALIFDDSPAQEGKPVVEKLADSRLIYQPHPQNLGRSKNLDHCFRSKNYQHGTYAYVLEDDNYLFPEFMEQNIRSLEQHGVNILLRNQEKRLEQNNQSVPMHETSRGRWFKAGEYTPLELYARLFFCEGISNGGLFWNAKKIVSNLQIGTQVEHAWHQELFRTLSIQESVRFEETPHCVFTEFEYHHKRLNFAPKHNRATQSILIYLVKKYKQEIIQEAQAVAVSSGAELILEQKLLNALYVSYPFHKINRLERLKIFIKSILRYSLYQDPFKQVLVA